MTANQIAYWSVVESERHNKATEKETNRHNVVVEQETYRHNTVVESETHRHNVVQEGIGWSQAAAAHKQANAALMNAQTNARLADANIARMSSETNLKWFTEGQQLMDQWYWNTVHTNQAQQRITNESTQVEQGWWKLGADYIGAVGSWFGGKASGISELVTMLSGM